MKAQCPTKCGRELGSESYVVCPTCFGEVPQRLKNDIARAALLVKNARKPMASASGIAEAARG